MTRGLPVLLRVSDQQLMTMILLYHDNVISSWFPFSFLRAVACICIHVCRCRPARLVLVLVLMLVQVQPAWYVYM